MLRKGTKSVQNYEAMEVNITETVFSDICGLSQKRKNGCLQQSKFFFGPIMKPLIRQKPF